jgi:transcriptional regulator with XRE-family HTH domain
MTRILDGSVSPIAFFGAELRRVREDAGMSQEQLGRAISFSGDLVGKIETCDRSPTHDFARRVDTVFPHLKGHFLRLLELARRWEGPLPQWFQDWLIAEREALTLRSWQPMLVYGLLQTADYARAIFGADPELDEDDLDGRVAARMERQLILTRPRPPELSVLLDEAVLHRCIGSAKTMYDQLVHVADMSRRPRISVQVVPAGVGTHAGLLGAFAIADFDGKPSILYVETAAEGFTIEKPARVRKAALAFDRLRAEALPRGASRDLIMKVAEERWTT